MADDKPNLNNISTQLRAFAEQTLKIESSSSRIDSIGKSIAGHYGSMAQKLAVAGLGLAKMTGLMSLKSKEATELQQLLTKALIQQNNVVARRERLLEATVNIEAKIKRISADPEQNTADNLAPLQKQLENTRRRMKELDVQSVELGRDIHFLRQVATPAAEAVRRLGAATGILAAGTFVTGFGRLVLFNNDLNRAVIKTNAELAHRQAILAATLDTQISIGADSQTMLDVQREMADIGARIYSQDVARSSQLSKLVGGAEMTHKAYAETLKTTAMLVEGLGASVREAVQLQITSRAINGNYADVANTISKIVDSTGLAADEAIRYARALTVASRVAVGANFQFDTQVFKRNLIALAGIEGAMKDSIGVQGEISNLLVKFSSYQKLGGLGAAFGTGGIDFLQRKGDQVGKVLGNIASSVQNLSGPMLEAYASMLEVSPETLIALSQEYKKAQAAGLSFQQYYAERQKLFASDADLQDRYNKQLAQSGETLTRLGKIMVVLAGGALQPLLTALNWVSIKLMGLFKLIGPEGPLGPITRWFQVGFGVLATGFLVTKLWGATRALFAFTASIARLAMVLQKTSLENAIASAAVGGGRGAATGGKGVVKEVVKDVATYGLLQKLSTAISGGFGRLKGLFVPKTATPPPPGFPPRPPVGGKEASGILAFLRTAFANASNTLRSLFGWVTVSVGAMATKVVSMMGSLFTRILVGTGALKDSLRGLVGRGSKVTVDLPMSKGESSAIATFFRNIFTNAKGFFSRIFGRGVATAAGETVAATASRGILARVLGGIASFFGGAAIRGIMGRVLGIILGLVGGVPGIIIGLVLTVIPLLWPHIKSLFSSSDKSNKTLGAGIKIDDFERKSTTAFMKSILSEDGKRLAISEKAYQSLIKAQGKTPEELDQLNKSIVMAIDRKIDVQSGAAQRDQGIDHSRDVENARAISEQTKLMGELSDQLGEFAKHYRTSKTTEKKAADEKAEQERRDLLIMQGRMLSVSNPSS